MSGRLKVIKQFLSQVVFNAKEIVPQNQRLLLPSHRRHLYTLLFCQSLKHMAWGWAIDRFPTPHLKMKNQLCNSPHPSLQNTIPGSFFAIADHQNLSRIRHQNRKYKIAGSPKTGYPLNPGSSLQFIWARRYIGLPAISVGYSKSIGMDGKCPNLLCSNARSSLGVASIEI